MTFASLLSLNRRHAHPRPGPVRVCFFIDSLSRAGTETQLLALIRSLDRTRVSPSLVLLDGTDDASRSLEPENCAVLRLGVHSLLRPSTLSAMIRLRRFWRDQNVDILQTYFLDSTYFGVPLARLCGIKKVIRVRNNLGYWMTGRHRRLGHWMGQLADITLTNSETGKTSLVEMERLGAGKVVVLENGVDLDRFPAPIPPLRDPELVRVGIVANLRPVKNIDGLVRAANLLRNSHHRICFEVAGEGEQRSELESLIAEHRLQDSFRLIGAVHDVPAFLARQDIAVLCSHSEGMSNALLEYMASRRAIVATDVGANGRLIENQVHGLVVAPSEDASLASAISWLINHPEEACEMAVNAHSRVDAEYSRSAMVRLI